MQRHNRQLRHKKTRGNCRYIHPRQRSLPLRGRSPSRAVHSRHLRRVSLPACCVLSILPSCLLLLPTDASHRLSPAADASQPDTDVLSWLQSKNNGSITSAYSRLGGSPLSLSSPHIYALPRRGLAATQCSCLQQVGACLAMVQLGIHPRSRPL